MVAPASPEPRPAAVARRLGRFELRQLLGKSSGTMVWLAFDTRLEQELMLTLPRVQPATPAAMERWVDEARAAARLNHPNLAHVVDIGIQENWPFVAVDRALGVTLAEWLADHPKPPPLEGVGWICEALQGVAFAHEAGAAHGDLQLHHLLISEQGSVRVMALAAAGRAVDAGVDPSRANDRGIALDSNRLRAQREAAERDVLACGLLLQHLLTGQAPLDEADTALVISRLPPVGREIVRLQWTTPHPIPEALRAIANRTTAALARQRYLNARTLLQALDGWRTAEAQDTGGPLALLLDRMRAIGHLPAMPGVGGRVARLTSKEGQRTDEMAGQILQDMALSFELLRQVNSAQVQGTQVAGNGPVLTIRRAIALVGINGIRQAAATLRVWPGPLNPAGAEALQRTMERARLAGHVAQVLCPAGYDPEVVFLVAVLQNLGRLLLRYHFADEAEQVWQLMRPSPPPANAEPGTPEQPGMTEAGASYAVLGVDIEVLGAAVARHWGLGEDVQHMIHRLPRDRTARAPEGDGDVLRTAASAANDAVDAVTLTPPTRLTHALNLVAQRYARALEIGTRDLQEAMQAAREALRTGKRVASVAKVESEGAAMPAAPDGR
ncbi:HDOD domain-containing protein [Piscinibacter sp.]|uniref:HDOD domain-containing protein n=1 Tax=Piscinibacter sp. TaxID=1903157 RepID=UPI002BB8B336|nr:HDOD domain-containing protein [Albitalea sp.]HUG22063.1 HDOD domain-containing protein [Albitalea sp.]